MTQHLSFSLKLIEMSSIMLEVYLALGGGRAGKGLDGYFPINFLLSTERTSLVETQ